MFKKKKKKTQDPIQKITTTKRAGGLAQVVECLPRKCEVPSSNRNTAKKKKKKKGLFWLMASEVLSPFFFFITPPSLSPHPGFSPFLWGCCETKYHGSRDVWQSKLFSSWHPGSREKQIASCHGQDALQRHTPSDLLSPTRPHLSKSV
jgi:hypothetical protein